MRGELISGEIIISLDLAIVTGANQHGHRRRVVTESIPDR
jgi:hypothetical protein